MVAQLHKVTPVFVSQDIEQTEALYAGKLGFTTVSRYPDYLIVERDGVTLHFSLCPTCIPEQNTSRAYLYVDGIDALYEECQAAGVVHPNGALSTKDYGMRDFGMLDTDHNLITFGEAVET